MNAQETRKAAQATSQLNTIETIDNLGFSMKQTTTKAGSQSRSSIGIGQWKKENRNTWKAEYPKAARIGEAYRDYCSDISTGIIAQLAEDKNLIINRYSVSKTGRHSIGAIRPSLTPSLQAKPAKQGKARKSKKAPTQEQLKELWNSLEGEEKAESNRLLDESKPFEFRAMLDRLWIERIRLGISVRIRNGHGQAV